MGRGPSIEARKNASDSARGQAFTKLIREITMAAKSGLPDPNANSRLRLAVDKALAHNMTKDTIERALKRASGADGAAMEEIRYEGYGPGGVAVMVDCMTDNPTRTVADVRHAFTKFGGNMGTSGSVAFQFARTGEIVFKADSSALEEKILETALDAGADDVLSEDGYTEVLTSPEAFDAVRDALKGAGLEALEASVIMRPAQRSAVDGETAESLKKMLAKLDELDDVQEVHHNAELPV